MGFRGREAKRETRLFIPDTDWSSSKLFYYMIIESIMPWQFYFAIGGDRT